MSVDLKAMVSQFLTPQLVSQIASTAGVDPDSVQKLMSGAIPAVLASLAGAVAAPGGAQKISDAVSNADPDLLAKLTSALGSGDIGPLNAGAAALGGLIGPGALANLSNALGQHADIPPEAAQSALGAVAQAAIGTIGQQDPSTWSDPAAIAGFLNSQKASILASLPAGLSGLGGMAAAAASRVSAPMSAPAASAASAANSAAARMAPAPAPASGGFPTWLIVVIVIVIIAAVAWFYVNKEKKPAAATFGPATIELALGSADSI